MRAAFIGDNIPYKLHQTQLPKTTFRDDRSRTSMLYELDSLSTSEAPMILTTLTTMINLKSLKRPILLAFGDYTDTTRCLQFW